MKTVEKSGLVIVIMILSMITISSCTSLEEKREKFLKTSNNTKYDGSREIFNMYLIAEGDMLVVIEKYKNKEAYNDANSNAEQELNKFLTEMPNSFLNEIKDDLKYNELEIRIYVNNKIHGKKKSKL